MATDMCPSSEAANQVPLRITAFSLELVNLPPTLAEFHSDEIGTM